ncbi:MAG TPA: amidohydrolase [Planctomycetes bacterium]|nr:amidohydrolase [Planctomycetota bacterium]
MGIIDFHTHAFPDKVAARAIPALEREAGIKAVLDGTLSALLGSMDAAGIERSLVMSIATRPEQFDSIMAWSRAIASERIVPLPSIHPADPLARERAAAVAAAGFKGVKLHPFYQDFSLDDPAALPLMEALAAHGLFCVCHTGFDIAFPRVRRCDPAMVAALAARVPGLVFVATHLGGWYDWEEVERHLLGTPVYMDISFTLGHLAERNVARMLRAHPADYLLFGTDSPWQDQRVACEGVRALGLGKSLEERLFHANAARLLGDAGAGQQSFPAERRGTPGGSGAGGAPVSGSGMP